MKNKQIALTRIKKLFKESEQVFDKNPTLADRYVHLARKISMKTKTKIPKLLKRKFCKHCYSYLKPGKNLRVRTKDKKIIYSCLICKKYARFVID